MGVYILCMCRLPFFFFFKYDRNSNLNSHTRIFLNSWGSNSHPHRGGFFGERITTGLNTQVAKEFLKRLLFFIFYFFIFFIFFMIEFKPMVSVHDGCFYHQAKTPIDFWCKRDLNLGSLLDNKRLY